LWRPTNGPNQVYRNQEDQEHDGKL
jgi:hypothetical protein